MNEEVQYLLNDFFANIYKEAIMNEARGGTSMSKVTRKSKIQRAAGGGAMSIARQKNDPLYKRYVKYNRMRKQLKSQIMRKYQRRALTKARSTMGRNR